MPNETTEDQNKAKRLAREEVFAFLLESGVDFSVALTIDKKCPILWALVTEQDN